MLNLVDIRGTIISGNLSNEELDTLQTAITFARNQIAKRNTRSFIKGDTVKFTSNRNGVEHRGTVEKVGIKNIVVRTHVGLYRVPANMIEGY
jgi:hypothetical protein